MLRICRHTIAIILLAAAGSAVSYAQAPSVNNDDLRVRITRAKALVAARNHAGAIFELEGVRRETSDRTVLGVANVLLMHCYVDMPDHSRAANFLSGFFDAARLGRPGGSEAYYPVASQIVRGGRTQADRYRVLGLTAADRGLPAEAIAELDGMRRLLEILSDQARALIADGSEGASALSLLEEATAARIALARDEYDSNRWRESLADARASVSDSGKVVLNAVEEDAAAVRGSPATEAPQPIQADPRSGPSERAVPEAVTADPESVRQVPTAKAIRQRRVSGDTDTPLAGGAPVAMGSLIELALQKIEPSYPATAKSLRVTGTVRVEMVVDEKGNVAEVTRIAGPLPLQNAAREAASKWKFKPLVRDGVALRTSGFLSFTFSL